MNDKQIRDEIRKKHCPKCGTQRCDRSDEWMDGCGHYKKMKKQEINTMDKKDNTRGTFSNADGIKEITPQDIEKSINDCKKINDDHIVSMMCGLRIVYSKGLPDNYWMLDSNNMFYCGKEIYNIIKKHMTKEQKKTKAVLPC